MAVAAAVVLRVERRFFGLFFGDGWDGQRPSNTGEILCESHSIATMDMILGYIGFVLKIEDAPK
jgi:hypothetical protein